eukprot:SAG11_NODE_111_length_16190_cov_9.912808_7_plen_267_part_00
MHRCIFKLESGDCAEVISRRFADGDSVLPNLKRLVFDFTDCDYTDEVWPIFELVLSQITRSHRGPVPYYTLRVDRNGGLHQALGEPAFKNTRGFVEKLRHDRRQKNLHFIGEKSGNLAHSSFEVAARGIGRYRELELGVYMAARCDQMVVARPQESLHMSRLSKEFQLYTCDLLEKCMAKAEVEQVLQESRMLLGGTTMLDFIIHNDLRIVAATRCVQLYLNDVWLSVKGLRMVPKDNVQFKTRACTNAVRVFAQRAIQDCILAST